MCQSKHTHGRPGSRLTDGSAHAHDHQTWSRRDFLGQVGLTAAAGTVALSGLPVRAFARTPFLARLGSVETDRVLVILQLAGGNDGLNTVVPFRNDGYFNARPSLAIRDSVALSDDFGLHPSLGPLASLYGEGRMGIVHSVGYPDPDLSHFRSTDIWMTAGDGNGVRDFGWAGQYLDTEFPDFVENPSNSPLAVQLGGGAPLLFQGPGSQMGMSIQSMELFERLATTASVYSLEGLPENRQGGQMAFLRGVANGSFRYAGAIQEASANGGNTIEYPDRNALAGQLAAVAGLIRGNLGTRIYHVTLGGFDTHASQAGTHANLMGTIAEAIAAFNADLSTDGLDERVLIMSFSEFGRRVQQNGSGGTDHGTAAPLFLFGSAVNGGFHGTAPDFNNLDNTGNLQYGTDFRSVYGSVLQQWFGMEALDVASVLGGAFPTVELVQSSTGTSSEPAVEVPGALTLSHPYPNPAHQTAEFSYSMDSPGAGRLELFDVLGRLVRTARVQPRPGGLGSVRIDVADLPPGSYIARFSVGDRVASKSLIVAR
jgi:uncharacterized protein (DUF1501 family)